MTTNTPMRSPMLSARELARQIDAGETTPAAVAASCAEAIAARDPGLRAFCAFDAGAFTAAAARPGLAGRPLAGLPVGVKDVFDTFDHPTSYGSAIWAGHRPKADAAIVALLRRRGGVVAGKTVTTEFAYFSPGPTRNPHDAGRTPGGSSSGSAAAVGAGLLPVALGTQTAGSVVRPASYCGVTGFKPSYRLLPTVGLKAFAPSLDTVGLFAASVADAAFAAAALTGRDLDLGDAEPAAPRLALVRTGFWNEATADTHAALAAAARAAERAGATVTEIDLPLAVADADGAQQVIMAVEAAAALAWEVDHHADRLSPQITELLATGAGMAPDSYDAARRTGRRARHALADLMTEYDAILTPAAPGVAPEGLGATGRPIFNRIWTLMGAPCIAVRGLTGENGLPVGVQVVGRFGRDRVALEIAAFVEAAIARHAG